MPDILATLIADGFNLKRVLPDGTSVPCTIKQIDGVWHILAPGVDGGEEDLGYFWSLRVLLGEREGVRVEFSLFMEDEENPPVFEGCESQRTVISSRDYWMEYKQ